jgi:eukaryotic-like serine/threonine-protein kinase
MPNTLDGALADDHLGRYRLVAPIGQGGMGRIYLAATSGLGEFRKLLVVKELQQELATNEKFVEMFLAEAKLAARLNHPNIVQTIEAGEENGRYFLAMEYLDGQPYTELLKRGSSEPVVTLATRLHVLCEVLSALQYAHELCDFDGTPFEIVHRDITPHNIFLTYHGQVKLVDFGIAKAVDVESLTSAGVFKGKFSYASPEQVRGEIVDQRSDLFAVGVMLWEAIALKRFSSGPATKSSIDRRIVGGEPRIAEVVPSVEPALADICDKALAVDKNQRYQSAAEFRADLQRYMLICGDDPPQQLGPLLCAKFAAERAAILKTIDAYSKRDDRNQSVIRTLRAMTTSQPPAPNDDRSTRITNAGRLAAANRSEITDVRDGWPGSLRRRTNIYPWIAGGVALVGAVAALLLSRSEPEQPPHLALPAVPPPQTSISPATTPQPSAEPVPAPAQPSLPQPGSPPPFAAESATARESSTTLKPRESRPRGEDEPLEVTPKRKGRSEAEDEAAARSHDGAKSHSRDSLDDGLGTESSSSVPVAKNPYRTPSQSASPASEPSIAGARADVTPRSSGATPGQDLRTLQRRPARRIDVEDPFR